MRWVASVVRVMPHWTWRLSMRSVSTENGSGGSSPGCISSAAQSMVRPSSRGGVPVLSRPSAKPARSSVRDRPSAGASPTRPAGVWRSPMWMRPRRNVPVVSTTAPAPSSRPSASLRPATRSPWISTIVGLGLDHREVRDAADLLLHGGGVELAVGLRARPAHRRPLAPVEHAELDAATVGDASHQPVERIDLAHQMALAEPADRRIARHGADGGEAMRHQRGLGAHARGRRRGLAARMPAAHDDHVKYVIHSLSLARASIRPDGQRPIHATGTIPIRVRVEPTERRTLDLFAMFHVKHPAQMVNEWLRDMVNGSLRPKIASPSHTSAIGLIATGPLGRWLSSETSFADAEIAEDHVQDVFDVDAPC